MKVDGIMRVRVFQFATGLLSLMTLSAAEPDVGLRGSLQPSYLRTGDAITYSLRITNSSLSSQATGAFMMSETPSNLTFVASSSTQGACAFIDGYIWCEFGTITNGANIAVSLTLRPDLPGSFAHTFQVFHDQLDLFEGDNWLTLSNHIWPPLLYIDRGEIIEGNSGTTTAMINLRLSAASAEEIRVDYYTRDWGASNGLDYLSASGTVTFPPFTTNQALIVTILGDETHEGDEHLQVQLHNFMNVHLGSIDAYALLTIRNDDTPPAFSIWDTTVIEGDQGVTNAVFLITLSKPAAIPLTLTFRTEDGAATRTNDYVEQSQYPILPAGATNLTVSVPVRGNTVNEPDEVFRGRLGFFNPTGAGTVARPLATATILNDDAVPGRLDHFLISPIASPQHQGVAFPVTVTAVDYENNPVPYEGTALLRCDTHSGMLTRLYENFEDIALDGWTNNARPGLSAMIVTNDAAEGNFSMFVSGQSSFYGPGLERSLTSISQSISGQPNRVGFYVKARRTNELSGQLSLQYAFYKVFRFGLHNNGLMGFFGPNEQQFRGVPYAAETWYKIGIDLNYERRVLDYYVDDALVLTNLSFLEWSYGNIDQIVIGSGSVAGGSWWDEFRVDATNVYLNLPITLTNITFANGVWNGEVAVRQFGTNAVLRVDDRAEHIGQSGFFNVLPPPQLALSFSTMIVENGGEIPAMLTSSIVLSNDLLVTLGSSDTSEAQVPETLLLRAGETSVAFNIEILDDNSLDGTQHPLIAASASGFISATNRLLVHDNEVGVLSIPAITQLVESMGPAQTRLIVHAPVETNVIVRLTSSDTNQLIVPPEAVILPGHTSVVFAVTVVNDGYIDGTAKVTVTAHVENWIDGTATFDVHDNESTDLVLFVTSPWSEGSGVRTNIANVILAGLLTTNLTVSLVSSDPSELAVPDFITIPAGRTSAVFQVTFVDDAEFDGQQLVTVAASALGFAAASVNVQVKDNEMQYVTFASASGVKTSGVPFRVTLEARDINGERLLDINRPVVIFNVTGTNQANHPVLINAQTIYMSGGGTASGTVTVFSPDATVQLFASDGNTFFAQSDPFVVVAPTLASFDIPAVDVAYDQASQKIYAAVGTNGTNRITVIDPHLGLVGSSVTLPHAPDRLAVSGNGEFLYVAFRLTNLIMRLELPTLQSNLLFSSSSWGGVRDMLVPPSSPYALIVASAGYSGIAVYDDGVKRPSEAGSIWESLITLGSSEDVLYGLHTSGSSPSLYHLRLSTNGVTLERQMYAYYHSYYREVDFQYDDGLLYTGAGLVLDPRDGTQVDSLSRKYLVADSALNRITTLYGDDWPHQASLSFYEQSTRSQIGNMSFTNLFGASHSLIRWGSNGVAFITSGGFSNWTRIEGKVHVVRPPHLVAQPAADLSVRVRADTALGLIDHDVTFTATVSNAGPNVVSNVYVRQGIRWTNVRASRTNINRWRDLEFARLAPGETFTVDFVCRTNKPYAFSNVVWAASAAHDPDTSNNTAHLTVPVTFQSLPDQVIEWPDLRVKDIASDRRGRMLYAIDMANRLLSLDPVRVTSSVALSLGTNAHRLEATPNGEYLYILQGTSTVRRFDLPNLDNPLQFNVFRPVYHMVVAPDRPELVAFGGEYWIGLYEGGVQRGLALTNWNCCGFIGFGTNHSRLYAMQYGGTIAHYRASDFGLAFEDAGGGPYSILASAGGKLYGSDGSVVDAETRLKVGQVHGNNTPYRNVLPDLASGILCYYSYPQLQVVDATTLGGHGLVQQIYTVGWVDRMVRWGDDGLAFKNDNDRLVLLRSYTVGDHDWDGLTDSWERSHLGSTSALPSVDADGDGMSNLAEFQAGTNPTNSSDLLRIESVSNNNLRFRSVAGKYYALERSLTLSTNSWISTIRNVPGNHGPLELSVTEPGFYRLKLVQ